MSMRNKLVRELTERFFNPSPTEISQPVSVNLLEDTRNTVPMLLNPHLRSMLKGISPSAYNSAKNELATEMEDLLLFKDLILIS